jgi:uncharacterized sodium:solute symporter family permease YidK
MLIISRLFPSSKPYNGDVINIDLKPWKYTKVLSLALVAITIAIYVFLGNI